MSPSNSFFWISSNSNFSSLVIDLGGVIRIILSKMENVVNDFKAPTSGGIAAIDEKENRKDTLAINQGMVMSKAYLEHTLSQQPTYLRRDYYSKAPKM